MKTTPERTEKMDGGAQARPFPFPLTLVERERDGSCYFVSSPDGKLDARHKRLVAFEVGCATDHAKHIEICVNSHADLVAQNEALRGALEKAESDLKAEQMAADLMENDLAEARASLGELEALATREGWNTPVFKAEFGKAVQRARALLTTTPPTKA